MAAAIRELKEETNIDLNANELKDLLPADRSLLEPFHVFSVRREKQVEVFLLVDPAGKLQDRGIVQLKCNSLLSDDGPDYLRGLPELDSFMFVTREEAHRMVFTSQKHLFEQSFLIACCSKHL